MDADDEPVGFALWFLNFSTWAGVHGIYLEDLYVRPAARGTGAGRALLATLAADLRRARLPSGSTGGSCDWNPAAEFYDAIGAERSMSELASAVPASRLAHSADWPMHAQSTASAPASRGLEARRRVPGEGVHA